MKEQELKNVSSGLEAKIKELKDTEKSVDSVLSAKKKLDTERYQKMVKLYKKLRPEEAAKLLDKLDEEIAFQMLDKMDDKTAAKLLPLMNQARVLKWTRLAVQGR